MEILLLNETKGRVVAKTLQSHQGTRAPAKNSLQGRGHRPTGVSWDHRC